MRVKLTKARAELLRDMASSGPQYAVKSYPPAVWLVAQGYGEWVTPKRGLGYPHIAITPAGRTALSQHEDGGEGGR